MPFNSIVLPENEYNSISDTVQLLIVSYANATRRSSRREIIPPATCPNFQVVSTVYSVHAGGASPCKLQELDDPVKCIL